MVAPRAETGLIQAPKRVIARRVHRVHIPGPGWRAGGPQVHRAHKWDRDRRGHPHTLHDVHIPDGHRR